MNRKSSIERGRRAEDTAQKYLIDQGLTLVARNHRCRFGELDLVLIDYGTLDPGTVNSNTLVVVEVRARNAREHDHRYATAAESVDRHKQNRIIMATRHLLRCYPRLNTYPIRFDVLTINLRNQKIDWIRNAFTL